MSTARQPAGQPTGGQFAATSGSDAGVDLTEDSYSHSGDAAVYAEHIQRLMSGQASDSEIEEMMDPQGSPAILRLSAMATGREVALRMGVNDPLPVVRALAIGAPSLSEDDRERVRTDPEVVAYLESIST